MKLLIIFYSFVSIMSTYASGLSDSIPISVKNEYKDHVSLDLRIDKVGNLETVSVKIKDAVHSVPKNLLKEVINADISKVQVSILKDKENIPSSVEVRIECNYRYYPWGWDRSFVTFYFSNKKFLSRDYTVPIEKGKYETVDSVSN